MKNYQEKPIPLILRNQQKKYQANPQALQFFSSLHGKVAVVSVAGIYRTGKSFLLNTMLLNTKSGFAVGPTTNAKTKGIWVWGKPLTIKNQDDQMINVIVLDSQGLGSTQQDINHDLRLFSITLLLSSAFLYNTVGSVDQNAIDSLGLVLRLCQHLKSQTYNDFPDFYWILRDFSLALVDKDSNPLTTKQYLQNCLHPQSGDSEIRNKIRESIRNSFQNRQCITFVRPLTDQSCLQNLDKMELDQLRPQFVQQVIDFRKNIFKTIKPKTIKGKYIQSEMLTDLVNLYTAQINGDKLPVIETGWKYVCRKECQKVSEEIENIFSQKSQEITSKMPQTKKQFYQKKEQILNQLKKIYKQKTKNNDQAQQFWFQIEEQVSKKFKSLQQQMHIKNAQQTKNFIRKQFQSVQKKIKQNDFKNMGELVKQFQVFYEYFRKKCPYKDQIQVGLQYLMKKISDCSLILFKSMKTKKDTQIKSLQDEMQKVTNQFIVKQQKYKQQKSASKDKITILESSIQNLAQQNKIANQNCSNLQNQLQKIKKQVEESVADKNQELQMQILNLKKKLMSTQDQLKQVECNKSHQISNLKNNLILKSNQIQHLNNQKAQFTKKVETIGDQLQKLKDQSAKTINQLNQELQRLKQHEKVQIKNLSELVKKKDSSISKLENCIESKVNQLEQLRKQKLKNHQDIESDLEKSKLIQSYKQQIASLKENIQTLQEDYKLKSKKIQSDCNQKQHDLKMAKLQIEKQQAITNQKTQFLKSQLQQKDQKIAKISQQNSCYLDIFQQKDNQISNLSSELQRLKLVHDASIEDSTIQINQLNQTIQAQNKLIQLSETNIDQLKFKLRQSQNQFKNVTQQYAQLKSVSGASVNQAKKRLQLQSKNAEQLKNNYENQIQSLKNQHHKNIEQQGRNAQISLVQLKNYYQMQKERLQKRILQQRKKHQYGDATIISEYENRLKKQQKMYQEEVSQLNSQIQSLQDQINRTENQFQMRISTYEQQNSNQRKLLQSKYQILERKYNELQEQLQNLQNKTNDDRMNFIKKIQGLNFQVSKKEKEILQLNSKKQNLQSTVLKKDQQNDNLKKLMSQQIQSGLKKISQTQNKYQKLNEQYLQFKIQADKELALCRQRNQFLNSKLSDLTKEKEVGSSKNLEKIDKQKISDLKQQIEKLKSQLLKNQSLLQQTKKLSRQTQKQLKGQISKLQKDIHYQNQRIELYQTKNVDLDSKIVQKNDYFNKQLNEIREKHQAKEQQLNNLNEKLIEKVSNLEDEKNNISWKLQREVALLNDKITYAEHQRDQAKKELEENEKRLQLVCSQLKKNTDKNADEQQDKRNSMDKRVSQQIQIMKQSLKQKCTQQEDQNKKLKDQLKLTKQKSMELQQKLAKAQKIRSSEKKVLEQNQRLRRQKDDLANSFKHEKSKQFEEWKRKNLQLQKRYKQAQRKNNQNMFVLQKQQSKWVLQKQNLYEKIKGLQDTIEWHKNSSQLNRSRLDSSKRSDFSGKFGGWK